MGAYDDLIPGSARTRRTAYDDLLSGGAPAPAAETAKVAPPPVPEPSPTPGVPMRFPEDDLNVPAPRAEDTKRLFEGAKRAWAYVTGSAVDAGRGITEATPGGKLISGALQHYLGQPTGAGEIAAARAPRPPLASGRPIFLPDTRPPVASYVPPGEGPGETGLWEGTKRALSLGGRQFSTGLELAAADLLDTPDAPKLVSRAREQAMEAEALVSRVGGPASPVPGFGPESPLHKLKPSAGDVVEAARQSITQLPAVAASIATRRFTPAAISLSAEVFPREYASLRAADHEPIEALVRATGQTGAELGPEMFALNVAMKTPIGNLIAAARRDPKALTDLAKFVGKVGGAEMGSEELSTVLNHLVDKGMADPRATPDQLLQDVQSTFRQMLVQVPMMSGTSVAVRGAPQIAQAARSAADRAFPERALARELQRSVDETQLTPPIAPVEPIVSRGTPRPDLAAAALEAMEEPARQADAERRLIEDAADAGGPEHRYDTPIAQHMARLADELPLPEITPPESEADRAPFGVGVRGGAVPQLRPDYSGGVSPIASTVDPEAARERVGRAVAREDHVGAPVNPRTVLKDKEGEFVVGQVSPDDWRHRVRGQLTFDELHKARNWYRQLHDTLTPIYGEEAPRLALGWLLSQKNASPSQGFMNVLRARDKVQGRPGEKIAGLNEKAIMDVLQGKTPEGGIGAKLHDFLDSELGLKTRTVMGRDPRGGQPAAIDIWALRDHGRVDEATMNYVRKRFGEKAAARLKQDSEGAGEAQYEYGSAFYNDLVNDLNKRGFAGGGWTAREVQAVGWVTMQKQMGVRAEFVEDIVSKNTRRVSIGLNTAHGAPRIVPFGVEEARGIVKKVADLAGTKVIKDEAGIGAYLGETEGSIQLDALASPESVRDFMNMLGYALQQSSVIATRPLKTGRQHAFEIRAPEMKGRENEFFQAMRGYSDLAVGFQPTVVDGVPGVLILNFEGHWGTKQLDELEGAAAQAAQELGLPGIDIVDYNVELHEARNDWSEDPSGGAYLKALRERGRLREASRLEGEFNPGRKARGEPEEEAALAVGVRAQDVVSEIDRSASPEEKVRQLGKLTRENKPLVDRFLEKLDRETGSRSKSNEKTPANILKKARRPSILSEKPWFDVEHVRDSFRFKSVLDDISTLPQIAQRMRAAGWGVVKVDTPKVLKPGAWGWRIVAVDLKLPNGQVVESYFPVAELEAAKERVNHELFERWRNEDLSKLSNEMIRAFERDIVASRRLYDAAWRAYLRRTGQTLESVKAALSSFERVLGSGSPISSTSVRENAMPSTQRPPTSERAAPSDMTRAREPSGEQSTVAAMPNSVHVQAATTTASFEGVGVKKASDGEQRIAHLSSSLISAASDRQLNIIAAAVQDLYSLGLPRYLVESIKGWSMYTGLMSSNDAIYTPFTETIGIRADHFSAAQRIPDGKTASMLRNWIAHELQHRLDDNTPLDPNGFRGEKYTDRFGAFTQGSPRLDYSVDFSSVTAKGDLFEEAFSVYSNNLEVTGPLVDYLQYPLAGILEQYDAATIKSELFAQLGALYFTNRQMLAKHLPKWHDLFEGIYGKETQADTLDAARQSLQQALQVEGAGERAEEGGVPAQDQRGDRERPASRGVGGGVGAGARKPPQPPAANRRGTVAGGVSWNVDQPGLADALTREFQNNQIDLRRVEEAIERAGGVIRESGRPYLTEELYHGRVSARIRKFERERVQPLLRAVKESGLTAEQFGDFLWARHAPERNAQILRVNPTLGAPGAGMDDATARQKMADLRRAAKSPQLLDRAVRLVDQITAETRAILVNEHLEERATIDAWERTYKNYVPLHRDTDAPREGKGFKVQGPESKRAMGSGRPAVAVLAAVISQHEAAVTRAEKARVGRDLVKLAEEFPNESFWRVDQPPTKSTINPTTGLVQVGIDPLYKFREDVFIVKDAHPAGSGRVRERVVSFNPDSERAMRLARAMQRLDVAEFGAVTKIVGKVSRFLANLATQWNPLFWATNFVRDVQTLGINVQSTKLRGQAPRIFARIPSAIAGIMHAEFADGQSTWAKHYRDFQEAGGQTGWRNLFEDLLDRQREIEKMVDRSGKLVVAPSVIGHWTAEQVSRINTAIENGGRLAAFVVARERGISARESASIAKNMTVNFNRKGNRSSVTAAWYMFFNANVQGTARMVQAMAKSQKVRVIVGALVTFGAALELLNRMIGDEDKDEAGNNTYELVDEHTKQRNWVVMIPGRDKEGRARRVTIPMPYGFNIFPSFGRLAMEAVLGAGQSKLVTEKRGAADLAWSMAETLIDAFIPLGQTTTPLQIAAPSIADPAVQALENKTWFGAPLVPARTRNNQQVPRSELFFASNSETAKDLARMLNIATGGDALTPGALDIHPGHIDHVLKTLTGGPGQFALGMFDFGVNVSQRAAGKDVEAMPAKRIPFVGKFYGEIDEREIESKFYRIKGQADPLYGRYRALLKAGDRDEADAIEENNPALIAFAKEAARSTFVKEGRELSKEMRETRDLPLLDRRGAKDAIKREQSQLYQRALEAYNAAAQERKGE